jgi:hypothetical protein
MFVRLLKRCRRATGEAGMTTAEYAVGTLAACGFAAVLYKVETSSVGRYDTSLPRQAHP